jgi:hypothetical protein
VLRLLLVVIVVQVVLVVPPLVGSLLRTLLPIPLRLVQTRLTLLSVSSVAPATQRVLVISAGPPQTVHIGF